MSNSNRSSRSNLPLPPNGSAYVPGAPRKLTSGNNSRNHTANTSLAGTEAASIDTSTASIEESETQAVSGRKLRGPRPASISILPTDFSPNNAATSAQLTGPASATRRRINLSANASNAEYSSEPPTSATTQQMTKQQRQKLQRRQPASVVSAVSSNATNSTNDSAQDHGKTAKEKSAKHNIMEQGTCGHCFSKSARIGTGCIPNACLKCCGMSEPAVQQAWREKVTLVAISLLLCGILAFITFGFNSTVCTSNTSNYSLKGLGTGQVIIYGTVYDTSLPTSAGTSYMQAHNQQYSASAYVVAGQDLSSYFAATSDSCSSLGLLDSIALPCAAGACHNMNDAKVANDMSSIKVGSLTYKFEELAATMTVFGHSIIDLTQVLSLSDAQLPPGAREILTSSSGVDGSMRLSNLSGDMMTLVRCLRDVRTIGYIDSITPGCIASQALLYISLVLILMLIVVRFFLAILFQYLISHKLGKMPKGKLTGDGIPTFGPSAVPHRTLSKRRKAHIQGPRSPGADAVTDIEPTNPAGVSRLRKKTQVGTIPAELLDPNREAYVILLVTAYSEDEAGLRVTLDSLAVTEYADDHKLIFIVADGIIKGHGNERSTPDIIVDMIDMDSKFECPPQPASYVAIADGSKRHNMAQVYAGWYVNGVHRVPTVLIVKCGTPEEMKGSKPGNRGKRDSQIILMGFLSKVLFDERMTSMEYDLFNKIRHLMGTTPDMFEIVLMVDADTKVMTDSLGRMVQVMKQDIAVMGLCGETRISNKSESWVTMIQVFEYFISHHLTKAFESMFGCVTCLPGCFCMYRIKAPKSGYWVPIIANPDILEQYSENVVDTLHKKNLLLLGEDRYLTTLMLRTFPKRKMMFVPRAICKTEVPAKFKVLLSQRRRWINSTIHNLLELVLVQELCGIFCFSMQMTILMELIGTATLPAAICFTIALVVVAVVGPTVPVLPLVLLAAVLGLPALLVLFTTRRLSYVGWCLIYILALPVWNFALPAYAFWHFDDFSWGETRKVTGETKDDHGKKEGSSDVIKDIRHMRWVEWEKESRSSVTLSGGSMNPDYTAGVA